MAVFHINYPSDVMNKYMAMNVILPDEDKGFYDNEGKYPLVYLLHGYTDDYTKWLRLTGIERYATERGITIVMPEGGKSFYTDMAHGDPHFTHITKEIPKYLNKWFPVTSDPNFTYIAGLSMGGYGALKIGLQYPEKFRAIGSFSGALAIAQTAGNKIDEEADEWLKRVEFDLKQVFEDVNSLVGTKEDVFWLISQQVASGNKIPDIYLSCGTEDFIYEVSKAYKQTLDSLSVPYKYYEGPGAHDWSFWDADIQRFLDWIIELPR